MNCWICPHGRVYRVGFHKHGKFANEIMGTNLPSEQAIRELAKLGWLHIGKTPFVSSRPYRELSDTQADAFFEVLRQVDGLIKQNLLGFLYA